MATLRQYYDTDFDHALRLHVKLPLQETFLDSYIFYDFSAHIAFFSCYVRGENHSLPFFIQLIQNLKQGVTQLSLDGKVTLPSARQFPGKLKIENKNPLEVDAQFFSDPNWISIKDIPGSKRVFIYSETALTNNDLEKLKKEGIQCGYEIQFRSNDHAMQREKLEIPLAFICHDSRDKDVVARKIAIGLQRMICPVWYDDFSLKVGDHLRESIETGLKKCKKCILVLSQNFFSNNGWTKKEFDSIFTREILEDKKLVLPVWYDVKKEQVFEYSPSLLNTVGINWSKGEDEVIRQLYSAIMMPDKGNNLENI